MSSLINWQGGEHEFALRLGELEALQKITGEGPGLVLARLHETLGAGGLFGPWKVADILDTIRLGLIGGGMDKIEARDLVLSMIERHGLPALISTAIEILLATFVDQEAKPSEDETEDNSSAPWDFDKILGAGGHLGLSPDQIKQTSIHDFNRLLKGVAALRSGKTDSDGMSMDELKELGVEI